jgi:hypothetical protein
MTRPSTVRWAGATIIAMGLVATSCSAAPVGYSPGAEAAFVAGCAPGGEEPARTVCTCVYRRLRDQYTFEQYRDIDRQLQQGDRTVPDEIKQAIDACNRETRTGQSASSGP